MVFPVICNSFNVPAALELATVLIPKTAAIAGRLAPLNAVELEAHQTQKSQRDGSTLPAGSPAG